MGYKETLEKIYGEVLKEKLPQAIKPELGCSCCTEGYGCFEISTFGRKEWEIMESLGIKDFAVCNSADNPDNVLVEFLIGRTYDNLAQSITEEEE